jgi:hypothetical protein
VKLPRVRPQSAEPIGALKVKPGVTIVRLPLRASAPAAPEELTPSASTQPDPLDPLGGDIPWPNEVDGATLLNDVVSLVRRYIVLQSQEQADAIALWILHTFAFTAWHISPILSITGPEKRCGKSTLMDLLEALCRNSIKTENISMPALFRTIERDQPTLLIDEADTFLRQHEELRGILNSGHRRNGRVIRCSGDNFEPRHFRTFCPKAIAQIGDLPDTVADRSIPIAMIRKKPGELVELLRGDRLAAQATIFRSRMLRWTTDNLASFSALDPDVPSVLNDRNQDNWRPLLSLADTVGGEWPKKARQAASRISAEVEEDDTSLGIQLLYDIRDIFSDRPADRLSSEQIIGALTRLEDRPWTDVGHGKPLTPRKLAVMLRPFRIKSVKFRISDDATLRGYERLSFGDAFERYLSPLGARVPDKFRIVTR